MEQCHLTQSLQVALTECNAAKATEHVAFAHFIQRYTGKVQESGS